MTRNLLVLSTPQYSEVSANNFFFSSQTAHLVSATSQQPCESLETRSGFFYTIKPGASKILLNISTATSAFLKPILVSEFIHDSKMFPGTSVNDRYNMLAGKRVVITYGRGKDQASRRHDLQDPEGRIKTIFEFSKKGVNWKTFSVTAEDGSETDQKVGEYLHRSKSPSLTM